MTRRHGVQAISEEEQIARYAYLLGNVPATIADKAYAAAFARLSAEQREEFLHQLRSQMPVAAERPTPREPDEFALFMRDLHARDALVRTPDAGVLAAEFITSLPIVAYFTAGAGSVTMDHQPPWVHALAGHETAPIDAGTMHHRRYPRIGDGIPL